MKHIFDDTDKNKFEAMDKAEILAAIQQIVEEGEIPQELINGVALTLRNPIDNQDYKIAFCTQAKYNELEAGGQLETNCYYYITDDTSYDDMVSEINTALEGFQSTIDLLPRTQELMQEEATEGQRQINVNNPSDVNNFIEITGYVRPNNQVTKWYFTQRLKVELQGSVDVGVSIIPADIFPDYLMAVRTRFYYYENSGSYISVSLASFGTPDASDYTYKILSVKELINY